tara:strand:+ start:575 stop:940 length:366 start_codon:yes stop_codon:yes gene_type:complete
MNKKGQGLSVNAKSMIALGIFVLVVLILGFTAGWKNITPWIILEDNVDPVDKLRDVCNTACSDRDEYCTKKRNLKMGEDQLSTININLVNVDYLELGDKYSCYELLKYPRLGIKSCSIDCD